GGSVILLDKFNASDSLNIMTKDNVTIVYLVEAMCNDIFKELEKTPKNLNHIRVASISPASQKTKKKVYEEWGVSIINSGYGLSETTSVVSLTRPEDSIYTILNTNGLPMEGVQIKIIESESLKECEIGELGEICVKGYTVLEGY